MRKGIRRITNIDEVKKKITLEQSSKYDIRFVQWENHTIKEQLEIANQTDIMVGVHGAGLTWSIFMESHSRLIEIYPGNSNTDNYIRWCNIAKIKYHRLCGTIVEGSVQNFRNSNLLLTRKNLNDLYKLF